MTPFPDFVSVGDCGPVLRHCGSGRYYRDAGQWDIQTKWKEQVLICSTRKGPLAHLLGRRVYPRTKTAWKKDNQGYLPKEFRRGTTKKGTI